ncbi:MAG: M16 family metallopeptidase [bacterium]
MAAEYFQVEGIEATRKAGGLFIISERLPYLRSVALGFAYRVGSRDDPIGQEGSAHLIEHMVFKGTQTMDARSINIFAESNGAELNGFTDKELTCFYSRVPSDHTEPMLGLMREILGGPAFAETELKKEREVVAEEIRMNEADPEASAVNLLLKAVYGDAPLGKPVVGTVDSIARVSSQDLLRFYQAQYGGAGAVVVAVGDIEHNQLVRILNTIDQRGGQNLNRQRSGMMPVRVLSQTRKDISQVYVCLARPAFAYNDPRRYALSVLNTALGGGVSSRLFQRLREDEGLVYSIGSFVELYEDCGLLGIYFVAEQRKLARCIAVLKEELARLRQAGIDAEEFERARNMTKSAVLLGIEGSTSRMLRLARGYLMLGRVIGIDEVVNAYNALGVDEVMELVEELFGEDRFYAGVVGPLSEKEIGEVMG